jgi:hypothetical protein
MSPETIQIQTTQTATNSDNQGTLTQEATPISPIPPITPNPGASAPTPTDAQNPNPDPRPKNRRLTRSSRPTGTPRARCSRASAQTSRAKKLTSARPKPFEPLPEFASLPPDQLEAIHDFIRHHTYEESIEFLREQLGVEISLNRLYRYRSRLDLATQLEIADDNAPAIENLLALLAGKPVDIDAAGLHVIKQRALALASRPDAAPSVLMNLFRIFTWEHRKNVTEHRLHSLDRRDKCRERITKVAERRQKLAERRQKFVEKKFQDELDRRPLSAQEQSEIAYKIFGDFPPVRPLDAPLKPVGI